MIKSVHDLAYRCIRFTNNSKLVCYSLHMDSFSGGIGCFYHPQKINRCCSVKTFIFAYEHLLRYDVYSARQIKTLPSYIGGNFFAFSLADPPISWLGIMCGVDAVNEANCFIFG